MIINFNYSKKRIDYVEGYIFKGISYRCNYTRFKTLYNKPSLGTETVELYNFEPKTEIKASIIIVPGLGSGNIPFLLWMGTHLASAGVHSTIIVLPGNYTRVENMSVSGRSYLWPDIDVMFNFWEHAVIDVQSCIDILEQKGLWKSNNIVMGYCLGGMISTIVTAIDKRINETILMTTGGNLPRILHESKAAAFARRKFKKGYVAEYNLHDKKVLYDEYKTQFPLVKQMSLLEITRRKDIHPLFKIDPISYGHLIDSKRVTLIDALIDETLPLVSRYSFLKEVKGAKRYILPMSHISWLPFERFIAQYILLKVNIKDVKIIREVLKKQKKEQNLIDYIINKIKI
jgi:hypothetical protein